jgi:hypothetical protein
MFDSSGRADHSFIGVLPRVRARVCVCVCESEREREIPRNLKTETARVLGWA